MHNPNASQTALDAMTDAARAFPCHACGAKLSFAPGTTSLKCEYCGANNEFDEKDTIVEELDLSAWLDKLAATQETHEQEHIKCKNCGGEQTLPANLYASACVFCGTPITSKSYAQRLIKPKSLVPFKITKLQAQDKWRAWIKGLWMAPNALKKYVQSDGGIKGLYVPYWTFDANTYTQYSGQRGDDRTESYTTTNSSGERVTQTRTVTDWTPVSGSVSYFHNDVLISGSRSTFGAKSGGDAKNADAQQAIAQLGGMGRALLSSFSTKLTKWNTADLVPYQEEYISGFQAEAYSVDLKSAFAEGKQEIDATVQSLVRQDIGGDHQRISSLNTQYSHLTFKHILLPMWVSAYLFKGKTYRFVVNGQTGEVDGESPKSGWKIFFIVAGILVALFLFLVIFGGGSSR
jgi:LSD1 subclass zinc finger protein